MNILESYNHAVKTLTNAKISSAKTDALYLLCHILNVDKAYIHAHHDVIIKKHSLGVFFDAIQKRATHVPLQYITGIQEFMSLLFYVDNSVLIPRQDTETLVETIIDKFKNCIFPIDILDIGTGSGCVSISIAKYLPNARITTVDISEKALETARKNAKLNFVENKIQFIQSNIYENLTNLKFDVIVSNPPYIPSSDIDTLSEEVKLYEPHLALDGGMDGLAYYRNIIQNSPQHLKHNGYIIFEVGIHQSESVKTLLDDNFHNIECIEDLAGIDRVVGGYFSG